MRFRSWINIALLIAVALVATAMFLLRDAGRLQPQALTELDPATVTQFEVRYADDKPSLRLAGDGGNWRIVEPIDRPARNPRMVRVLSFLNDRVDSCYAENEDRQADFGLDQPKLTVAVDDVEIDFGDRTQGGRRYVGVDERLCVIDDVAYPLLSEGLSAIAEMSLLPSDATPVRIRAPGFEAVDPEGDDSWEFDSGEGAGQRWSVRWRSTSAAGFELDPPDDDHGEIAIELADGVSLRWRIAAEPGEEQELILVPEGQDYGLRIEPADAAGLIEPPQLVEDGLN